MEYFKTLYFSKQICFYFQDNSLSKVFEFSELKSITVGEFLEKVSQNISFLNEIGEVSSKVNFSFPELINNSL